MTLTNDRFSEIADALPAAVNAGVLGAAELVAAAARLRVPVETGRLLRAIHVEHTRDGARVVAGNHEDAFYGHIVEHGSVHAPAHPFLHPAMEESRPGVERIVAEAIRTIT